MNKDQTLERFDSWLTDEGEAAALTLRQWLIPVEGKDAVVFPPTYAAPDGRTREDWTGYNIDRFDGGSNVCQIDSVGSQANRIEPIFKRIRYKKLVPQVVIKAGDKEVNLLDAGHRAADAIVRFSDLSHELEAAFRALLDEGNAEPLAQIAPTSLIFGAWDSRGTRAKIPRAVRSVIRAFEVDQLTRSAQYTTIAGEILEGTEVEVTTKGPKAELGLAHVPATQTHGGIRLRSSGEIRREAALNLVVIRALGGTSKERTLKLRRYILGLSLVSFTAPIETNLREGCQLVPDMERKPQWTLVYHDGQRKDFSLSHSEALAYAEAAAKDFSVGKDRPVAFNPEAAKKELGKSKEERKASRRSSTVKAKASGEES